jgi:glycosyltransferase involved in cell wall biosynthesis/Ser/Thr protein kinase RdoA (MazF antagonist)
VTAFAAVPAVPRPSRVASGLAARLGPPAIEPSALADVLARFGLEAASRPRNLRLGRRSHNVAVVTSAGEKVVKRYRPQWSAATVACGHSVLEELERSGFPAPRLCRTPAGETWTGTDGEIYAVFDFLAGTNYALTFLLRSDRLTLTRVAGRTLARLHHALDGFVPGGRHHLGFPSHSGPRRRDLAWHEAKVAELRRRSATLDDAGAALAAARLAERAGPVLDAIGELEGRLAAAAFPRLVIHGDYGPHNLLVRKGGQAVPVDFELARLDWRCNDLISALGKFRYRGGDYDLESMATFLRAYAGEFPLTADERRLLPDAWRLYKLQAGVQYWNSYFETAGPLRKLSSAGDSLDQAEWVVEHGGVLRRLVADAEPLAARPGRRARLTVMQVTPDLEIGGAQETVRTLAAHLPAAGCPTLVCTFGGGPLASEIAGLGVPVEKLPPRRWSVVALPAFAWEIARRRADLRRLVARYGVDVVQTQGLGTLDFLVMTLRTRRDLQVWWTIQNARFTLRAEHLPGHAFMLGPKRALHRRLYRAGTRLVDGVIAVSEETAAAFRDVAGDAGGKLVVVGNAADVERYPARVDRDAIRARLGFGPAEHLMTVVGTFKPQKGHRYLVEAAGEVLADWPAAHVLLVGDGELAGEVRAQVGAAGLGGRVHFLGSRRDVPQLLAASDSFVLPSLWEGLPVALVEALASGLPVIATAVSGTSQVVLDGVTGWLVPPADSGALAAAMRRLLADPGRAAAMGAAGRRRVARSFSARGQAEHLAALFRDAAGGQRHPA